MSSPPKANTAADGVGRGARVGGVGGDGHDALRGAAGGADLGGGRARGGAVEVRHDDVRSFVGETRRDGAPDAARAARYERDVTGELALALLELGHLERPVLDRQTVGLVEEPESAQPLGGGHDAGAVAVAAGAEGGVGLVLHRGHDAEPRQQHDARHGRQHLAGDRVAREGGAGRGGVSLEADRERALGLGER